MTEQSATLIHPTAEVSPTAVLGEGCRVWRLVHIREQAVLGHSCSIGAGVYLGVGVHLGAKCKVQNGAMLYEGLVLEDGVFVGPQVCFTNDLHPRAVNPDMSVQSIADWELRHTYVREGASIGGQTVVTPGLTIGRWALIGAGTVLTREVPDHALVYGQPGRIRGWVCRCARRLRVRQCDDGTIEGWCARCRAATRLPMEAADFLTV